MSKRRSLSTYDLISWGTNIILFGAPFFGYVLKQISEQQPINRVIAEAIAAGLILNLLKKFVANNQPKPITPTV